MKSWEDSIFVDNEKVLNEAYSAREKWASDAAKYDMFRYGQHFSPTEVQDILAFKQAPLPINITAAIIETAEAYLLSNDVVINVSPVIFPNDERRNASSSLVSQLYSVLLKETWYQSLASLHFDRAVRDYLNVGRGTLCAIPKFVNGEFRVEIAYVPWRNYFPDPAIKSPFYDDADYHCLYYEVSYKSAYRLVKSYEPDITFEQFKEDFIKGARLRFISQGVKYEYRKREAIPLIQVYELSEQDIYKVIANSEDVVGLEYKTYMKNAVPDYIIELAKLGKIYLIPEKRFYLTEKTSIGSKGFKQVYPIETYNIINLVHDHRDNPYPQGKISYIYPLQRALNKFIMIAILNGSLLNVTRVMAEENSVIDENEWITNASVPNTILKYRLPTSVSKPPQVIEAKPLSDSWLHMPQYLMTMMEYISGIFATMMGNPEKSPDVFSTVAALQTTAGQRLKRRTRNIYNYLSVLGKVVANFYKEYAPPAGYMSYVDTDGQTKVIEYNKIRVDERGNVVIDENTDLGIGFKDVRFVVDSSSGYESATEAAMLTTLATQLQIPQLVPLILKRINIPDVQNVVNEINALAQAQMTIQQQQKVIKDLESRIKIMANQIEQGLYKISKSKFDAAFAKMLAELKSKYNTDLTKYKTEMEKTLVNELQGE